MDDLQTQPQEQTVGQKLQLHLDRHGIKYVWLAEQLGFSRVWVTRILSGDLALTDDNKNRIEEILNIKL